MKATKLFVLLVPATVALAAAHWTSLAFWSDMKEGMIAFLGFLAASLVQVMPVTANFLQSDRLNPTEAEKLTNSLTRQQHYWIGLLAATVFAMVIVIFGAALNANSRIKNLAPLFQNASFVEITWEQLMVFVLVASFSFVLVKMLGLFEGILSLHHLRGELVVSSAKRSAQEKLHQLQNSDGHITAIVPASYGQVVSSQFPTRNIADPLETSQT